MGKNNELSISSIQAGSLYDYQLGNRIYLDLGSATLPNSLFLDYLYSINLKVNEKKGTSKDLIMVCFDYGTNNYTGSQLRTKYYNEMITINWTSYHDKIEQHNIDTIKDENEKNKAIEKRQKRLNRVLKDNIITYKMLMRSVGKAKDGDITYINEQLWDMSMDWLTMGLYDKMPQYNTPIVELSAYQTLTTAVKIGEIILDPKNVLILDDLESFTKVSAVSVKVDDVSYVVQTLNYKQIEIEANEAGYTFYKTKANRDGYNYITNRSIKVLEDLEIGIIRNKKGKLDIKSMEPQANKLRYSFYSKLCKKDDGFTLISKDEETINDYGFNKIYKDIIQYKKECYVDRHDDNPVEVKNTMWDGMGILDHSYFSFDHKEFMYCRTHMTKVCWFDGNVIQYLKDYYGDRYYDDDCTLPDKFGNNIKVKDIHAITTDNAVKWLKFKYLADGGTEIDIYNHWCLKMSEIGNRWGIVKSAHSSKYGDLQRSSYQMNNSIPTTDYNILTSIAQCTIDFTNGLKEDDDKFLKYLSATNNSYTINDVILGMAEHNSDFLYTKWYKTRKSRIISKLKRERFMLGKLMQNAANLTIASNVMALLLYATGQDWTKDPTLNSIDEGIQCYTKRFDDAQKLCTFRSPHNSPNNICYLVNHYSPDMRKYFPNIGENVLVVNNINTDVQSRLNGCDYDSDFCYTTDQLDLVHLAKKCYEEYPTIINEIPEEKKSNYNNTMDDYSKMDNTISNNQMAIGWSSNLSQLALSYYYNKMDNMQEIDEELEDVFIIGSVIAQLAIDSSKKTFVITPCSELTRLSQLECMKVEEKYPKFYAEIQKNKIDKDKRKEDKEKKDDKKSIDDLIIVDCKCPMQILADIIDKGVIDGRGTGKPSTDIENLFIKIKDKKDKRKIDGKQISKIEKLIDEYDKAMQDLNSDDESYKENAKILTSVFEQKISKLTISKITMNKLISKAMGFDFGTKDSHKYCERIIERLYTYDKKMFLEQFVENNSSKNMLKGA